MGLGRSFRRALWQRLQAARSRRVGSMPCPWPPLSLLLHRHPLSPPPLPPSSPPPGCWRPHLAAAVDRVVPEAGEGGCHQLNQRGSRAPRGGDERRGAAPKVAQQPGAHLCGAGRAAGAGGRAGGGAWLACAGPLMVQREAVGGRAADSLCRWTDTCGARAPCACVAGALRAPCPSTGRHHHCSCPPARPAATPHTPHGGRAWAPPRAATARAPPQRATRAATAPERARPGRPAPRGAQRRGSAGRPPGWPSGRTPSARTPARHLARTGSGAVSRAGGKVGGAEASWERGNPRARRRAGRGLGVGAARAGARAVAAAPHAAQRRRSGRCEALRGRPAWRCSSRPPRPWPPPCPCPPPPATRPEAEVECIEHQEVLSREGAVVRVMQLLGLGGRSAGREACRRSGWGSRGSVARAAQAGLGRRQAGVAAWWVGRQGGVGKLGGAATCVRRVRAPARGGPPVSQPCAAFACSAGSSSCSLRAAASSAAGGVSGAGCWACRRGAGRENTAARQRRLTGSVDRHVLRLVHDPFTSRQHGELHIHRTGRRLIWPARLSLETDRPMTGISLVPVNSRCAAGSCAVGCGEEPLPAGFAAPRQGTERRPRTPNHWGCARFGASRACPEASPPSSPTWRRPRRAPSARSAWGSPASERAVESPTSNQPRFPARLHANTALGVR